MNTRIPALCALAIATALAAGTAQADFKERHIKVSTTVNREHSLASGMVKMAQCAAEKSGGKMKITLYPGAVLGSDPQVLQQLRTVSVDMMSVAPSTLTGFLPAAAIFDLPFLFQNEKEADTVLDGKAGTAFGNLLPSVGLVHLAWTESGFKHLLSSRKPVTRWEDLQGQKVRVVQSAIFVDTFTGWGAIPSTLAFSELYSALETRTVDGAEQALNVADTAKLYEVQKYLSLTRHAYQPTQTIYSKRLFDQLSPQEQATLRDCAVQGRDEQRRLNREHEARNLAKFKRAGMVINELDAAEVARMREKAQPVYDKYGKSIGAEIFTLFQDELKAARGK
jgi:tripartite ATP-independent transporter DctP family solute receptor